MSIVQRRFSVLSFLSIATVLLAAISCGDGGSPTEPVPPVSITSTDLPDVVIGIAYSEGLEATGGGGAGTYEWSMWDGSLPKGLTLSPDGTISGTPVDFGGGMFTVEVTSGGQTGIKTLMISVIPTNDLGPLNFALIPAGTFQMGRPNGFDYEKPVHSVTLTKSFYMQRTEVTQGQWKAVMGDNPSWFPNCGDACPVEEVSWFDIQSFLAALNAANPGMNYRLPTEAEWEYAARAGTTGDHYLESGNLDQMAWHTGNSGEKTHYVGLKEPNAWGLYDMYGNVWEWVNDWYYDYSGEPETDPTGPSVGTLKGTRGGGWMTDPPFMDSGRRSFPFPSSIYFDMGFRLMRIAQ